MTNIELVLGWDASDVFNSGKLQPEYKTVESINFEIEGKPTFIGRANGTRPETILVHPSRILAVLKNSNLLIEELSKKTGKNYQTLRIATPHIPYGHSIQACEQEELDYALEKNLFPDFPIKQ